MLRKKVVDENSPSNSQLPLKYLLLLCSALVRLVYDHVVLLELTV